MKPNEKYALLFAFLVIVPFCNQMASSCALAEVHGGDFLRPKFEVNSIFLGSLKHQIRIENPTMHRVSSGELYVPLISNQTSRHYVVVDNVSASIGLPKTMTDSSGNTYAYWTNVVIEPLQEVAVEIDYRLISFGIRYLIDSNQVSDFNTTSDLYRKYTQPEDLIESNDPLVVSKAKSVTDDEQSIEAQTLSLYTFVIENLRYEVQNDEKGALWALKNKVGDCSEFSYLFVALCRAVGIPARIETGFAFNVGDETTEDGHMWAEYYLEDYGWVPVDTTWEQYSRIDSKHIASMQGIPDLVPYCNFFLEYDYGPARDNLDEAQSVSIKSVSGGFEKDSKLENVGRTVDTLTVARLMIAVEKALGASLFFPSRVEEINGLFVESQIHVQRVIESWIGDPNEAQQESVKALEAAVLVLQRSETLMVYVVVILGGISIVAMLLIVMVLRRSRRAKARDNLVATAS